jgi:non-ribosomal peptide synthetase component F
MSDGKQTSGSPASLAQQMVWLHEERGDLHAAYHLPFTLSFHGDLDRTALLDACRTVVTANPILSSAFRGNGTIPQLVAAENAPEIALADFSQAPSAEAGKLLADAIRHDISRTFDLHSGPLIRITLFALSRSVHVLLVVPHHLVFDGLSTDLFKRELAEYYRASLKGEAPRPATAYAPPDYAAEDERRLATVLPAAREFWRERWLEPGEVALPGVVTAPGDAAAGDCVPFILDKRQHARLEEAASEVGVTTFEFLLASLYTLLRRYGNTTPVIGVTLGIRTEETRNRIGFFSHEVSLAQRVDPALAFSDFAVALRADLRQLYQFRGIPVTRAITGLSPAAAQAPVIISYRRHDRTVDFPGMQVTAEWQFNFAARGALWIQSLDESESLRVFLRYSPRVMPRESVDRIAGHWQRLLGGAVASPAGRLGALPLLGSEERQRQLASPHWPSHRSDATHLAAAWPELFAAQLAERPGKVAVVCGEDEITYGRLDAGSDGLAQRLRCSGVGHESVVVIRTRPSIAMVTALLAVHKAGAAYLPLAPGCPASEVAEVAAAVGACAVLGDGPTPDETPMSGEVPGISADERGCVCGRCPADVAAGPHSATLAGVVRSSAGRQADGSGWVAIEHGALASRLNALRTVTRTEPQDTWLAHSALSAGMSAFEVFLPLAAGARVVIARERDSQPEQLLQLIRRHRVTHVQATAATWRLLLDAGFDEPSVTAVAGGMPPPSLIRRLGHRVRTLLSAYGQPETAMWSIAGEFPSDAPDPTTGRPIPGTCAYILDECTEMMPIGSIGELCIGGPALARGYMGDPTTTAERFVADRYGVPGARLFRTGQRARYQPDGYIEFLGSIGDSVLLRGHPVDLGRIEARLAAHPGVDECAVAPHHGADEGTVTAYWVPTPDGEPSDDELETWLTETLPRYMAPTEYVAIDRFPRTAEGAIDRERMQEQANRDDSQHAEEKSLDAPQELQQDVAEIFQAIPQLKNIGLHEDVFSLGIDSLTIAQISTRIRLKLKVDIPWDKFYDSPTIVGISNVIAHARGEIS